MKPKSADTVSVITDITCLYSQVLYIALHCVRIAEDMIVIIMAMTRYDGLVVRYICKALYGGNF